MDVALLLLLSIAVLLYALVSNRAFGQLISAPLVFMVFGLFLGDVGIGWVELPVSSGALNTLAEVTLMLTLFDFAEAEGELLSLFVLFALGAVLLPAILPTVQWSHVLYAILSLTVVRMLPVALCLFRLRLDRKTLLCLGWFGPRGLASVIYLLILSDDYSLDAIDQIGAVVLLTVSISIVLHGVSAAPLAKRFAASSRL